MKTNASRKAIIKTTTKTETWQCCTKEKQDTQVPYVLIATTKLRASRTQRILSLHTQCQLRDWHIMSHQTMSAHRSWNHTSRSWKYDHSSTKITGVISTWWIRLTIHGRHITHVVVRYDQSIRYIFHGNYFYRNRSFIWCWGHQEVMALSAQPDALSSIPGTHDGGGQLTREGWPLTSTCLLKHTHMLPPPGKKKCNLKLLLSEVGGSSYRKGKAFW